MSIPCKSSSMPLVRLALGLTLAACLTACADPSREVAVTVADKPVLAQVAAAPALPDIPKATVDCLSRKPPSTKSADETVKALQAMDKSKRECAAAHFLWHREQQTVAVAAKLKEPVMPVGVKKKPAATWE